MERIARAKTERSVLKKDMSGWLYANKSKRCNWEFVHGAVDFQIRSFTSLYTFPHQIEPKSIAQLLIKLEIQLY